MNDAHALTPAITLLLVGVLAILLTRRIGQSPIVGYLAAGVLIGPHALGLIEENKTTHLLAELGVVFLLFDIGLHFSLSTIWEARRDIFGMGPSQILACGLVFGVIALAFGLAPEYAIILGGEAALARTSGWFGFNRIQPRSPVDNRYCLGLPAICSGSLLAQRKDNMAVNFLYPLRGTGPWPGLWVTAGIRRRDTASGTDWLHLLLFTYPSVIPGIKLSCTHFCHRWVL